MGNMSLGGSSSGNGTVEERKENPYLNSGMVTPNPNMMPSYDPVVVSQPPTSHYSGQQSNNSTFHSQPTQYQAQPTFSA